MSPILAFSLCVLVLFAGMVALMELGRHVGVRHLRRAPEEAAPAFGEINGAILGLMGLVIAFTFSGAGTRFDQHRQLIVQETSAIQAAYQRLDLLPVPSQTVLREDFKRYVDARLGTYQDYENDSKGARTNQQRARVLQAKIWGEAVAVYQTQSPPMTLFLTSLNEMNSIATARDVAMELHPPSGVYWALAVLVLTSSLLVGYATAKGRRRSWVHVLIFASIMAVVMYVILDLEFPRLGYIRADGADRVLVELQSSMK